MYAICSIVCSVGQLFTMALSSMIAVVLLGLALPAVQAQAPAATVSLASLCLFPGTTNSYNFPSYPVANTQTYTAVPSSLWATTIDTSNSANYPLGFQLGTLHDDKYACVIGRIRAL